MDKKGLPFLLQEKWSCNPKNCITLIAIAAKVLLRHSSQIYPKCQQENHEEIYIYIYIYISCVKQLGIQRILPYGNYTRMLRAILNKFWQQHATRRQLYGCRPPITKTIQAIRTRHDGHCLRSKDEIVSDVLLWTPAYGQSKAGRPARTRTRS